MEITEKQKKIMDVLKEEEEIATTKISFLITSNLYQTKQYLEELEAIGLVTKIDKGHAVYWKIKEEIQK